MRRGSVLALTYDYFQAFTRGTDAVDCRRLHSRNRIGKAPCMDRLLPRVLVLVSATLWDVWIYTGMEPRIGGRHGQRAPVRRAEEGCILSDEQTG